MRIWREKLTVLAIACSDRENITIGGITEKGEWYRIKAGRKDLINEGETFFRNFGQSEIYFCNLPGTGQKESYKEIYWDESKKPKVVNDIKDAEQKVFLDKHLDRSVYSVFEQGNDIGLVKVTVENVEFYWNKYLREYEAYITFKDYSESSFRFPCTEIYWNNYWKNVVNSHPQDLPQRLCNMQWILNEQDTYFVIGLTSPVPEWPGPFNGCWPIILGIHSLPGVIYFKEYAYLV